MKQQLEDILGVDTIRENVDLFPYLSMRLHTKAQYFFEAKTREDFLGALRASFNLKIPLIMVGGGSNMVFHDSLITGLVVKNSYSDLKTVFENRQEIDIEVGSGMNMALLIQHLEEKGYSGLEYQKGLPGTVGGGVYMNSKWTLPVSYVGDCVLGAELSDAQGNIKKVDRDYFQFAYGYSKLQDTHEYIVSVIFRLKKMESGIVIDRALNAQTYRHKTQPFGKPTCGCFFRNVSDEIQKKYNLPTKSAGYLIDKAGLKGKSIGSFMVSDVHANFIMNKGGDARPEDLKALSDLIKQKVKEQFGIELKEEVEIK
jgi:UDP-N-acetylmuramate dehydrogenase